jgi:hypothetical protein
MVGLHVRTAQRTNANFYSSLRKSLGQTARYISAHFQGVLETFTDIISLQRAEREVKLLLLGMLHLVVVRTAELTRDDRCW